MMKFRVIQHSDALEGSVTRRQRSMQDSQIFRPVNEFPLMDNYDKAAEFGSGQVAEQDL